MTPQSFRNLLAASGCQRERAVYDARSACSAERAGCQAAGLADFGLDDDERLQRRDAE